MSINKVRSRLYTTAKILGDVNAVQKHHVAQRLGRRIAGKYASRLMNNIFR